MPTTLDAFFAMQLHEQLYTIVSEGNYLAWRQEEEDGVNLYNLGAFFCEVYYTHDRNKIMRTRVFTDSESLIDYAACVKLTDLGLEV